METIKQLLVLLLPHWPFVAATLVFMLVGTVANKRIFTEAEAAKKRKLQWFFWWARKTLPLHPVVTGVLLGIVWKLPEAGVDTLVERAAYFGLAGACSVFAYELLKGLAKKRGIDLALPGDSPVPPAPTTPTTPGA